MTRLHIGLIAGLAFGLTAVLLMLPMRLPDRRTALSAAFCSRFAIGFVTPLVALPWPGIAIGAVVGVLISLPDAIVTKAYAPILLVGGLGGALIGFLVSRVGQ